MVVIQGTNYSLIVCSNATQKRKYYLMKPYKKIQKTELKIAEKGKAID